MITFRPRSLSRRPRLEAVSPLPRLDATPPVTKRCRVDTGRDRYADAAKGRLPGASIGGWNPLSTGHQDNRRWVPGASLTLSPFGRRPWSAGLVGGSRWWSGESGQWVRRGPGWRSGPRACGPRRCARRPGAAAVRVGLAEPAQNHRAAYGERKTGDGQPGHAGPGAVAEEHHTHRRR